MRVRDIVWNNEYLAVNPVTGYFLWLNTKYDKKVKWKRFLKFNLNRHLATHNFW